MGNEKVYNLVSKHFNYNNMSKYNPFKPFVVWANTNSILDDYYITKDGYIICIRLFGIILLFTRFFVYFIAINL